MTLDECIVDCEQVMFGAQMMKQTEAYNYNRQLAKWLKELKAYREAREEIGCLTIVWEEGVGIRKCIDILDKHLMGVNADEPV